MKRSLSLSFLVFSVSILAIWSMPFYEQLGGYLFSIPHNHLTLLILLLTLFTTVLFFDKSISVSVPKSLFLFLFLIFISTVFAMINGSADFWPQKALFLLIILFFSLLVAQKSFGAISQWLLLIVVIGVLQVAISYSQLFYIFPFSDYKFSDVTRPVGTFMQVNAFASFVSFSIVSNVLLFVYHSKQLKVGRITLGFALLLLASGVSASQSRAGLLGLVIGLVFLFIVFFKRRQTRRKFFLALMLVLVGLMVGLIMLSVFGELIGTQVLRSQEGMEQNSKVRLLTYLATVGMMLDFPKGVGVGNFPGSFVQFVYANYTQEPLSKSLGFMYHPHNEVLMWAAEYGLYSALVLLLVFFIFFLRVFSSSGLSRGMVYLALLSPIGFHAMVEMPFYLSFLHLVFFIVVISLAMRKQKKRTICVKVTVLTRAFAVFMLVISVAFFVSGWGALSIYNQLARTEDGRIDIFYDIKNPFILTQELTAFLAIHGIRNAIQFNNQLMIQESIEYGVKALKIVPSPHLFYELARAHLLLDETENAKNYIDFYNYFYSAKYGFIAYEQLIGQP